LLTNSKSINRETSAAKAAIENKPVIATLKRCATQKQIQQRVVQQSKFIFGSSLSPWGKFLTET
jgi:hypothetical protein